MATNQDTSAVSTPDVEVALNETPVTPIESGPVSETTESDKKDEEKSDSKDEKSEDKDEKSEDKSEETEKILIGAVSEVKELYAKYDKDGNRSWSEDLPDDLVEAAENEKSLKYAVLVRKSKFSHHHFQSTHLTPT